jgi:hypothetical protein
LQESGFPLEARVGIEAVRRFKQSTNSLKEKPEVKSRKCKAGSEMAATFCWSENVGKAIEEITCDLVFSEKLSGPCLVGHE